MSTASALTRAPKNTALAAVSKAPGSSTTGVHPTGAAAAPRNTKHHTTTNSAPIASVVVRVRRSSPEQQECRKR